MAARVQPNSPTDHPEDIRWQVFNAWSFGVGDMLLGTNPVSGGIDKIAAVEHALQDLLATFKLEGALPHCCLTHIDAQAEAERRFPGCTALWFQSLGSTDAANAVFGKIADRGSRRALLHLIGERPGSEHHSFSVYLSAPKVEVWAKAGTLDHDVSRVVANIADTALAPDDAVRETVAALGGLF